MEREGGFYGGARVKRDTREKCRNKGGEKGGCPGKVGYARGKGKEGGKKEVARGKRDTREKWKKKGRKRVKLG